MKEEFGEAKATRIETGLSRLNSIARLTLHLFKKEERSASSIRRKRKKNVLKRPEPNFYNLQDGYVKGKIHSAGLTADLPKEGPAKRRQRGKARAERHPQTAQPASKRSPTKEWQRDFHKTAEHSPHLTELQVYPRK